MKMPETPAFMQQAALVFSQRSLASRFLIAATFITVCLFAFVYSTWDYSTPTLPHVSSSSSSHGSRIPKIIWHKMGPKGLDEKAVKWGETCMKDNQHYKVEYLTDMSADNYVQTAFAKRPDIVEIYMGLSIPILKADILRYLLLVDQGGIWTDIDVSCIGPPIDDWVPDQYKDDASIVVGLEYDLKVPEGQFRQFCSWTIMAKPGSPHMWMVVEDIMDRLKERMARDNVRIDQLKNDDLPDVIELTGPKGYTKSILRSLSINSNINVTVPDMSFLVMPRLFGDVLIMPGYSFAAGMQDMYKKPSPGPQLVEHHYAGSWKNDKGGESKRRRTVDAE